MSPVLGAPFTELTGRGGSCNNILGDRCIGWSCLGRCVPKYVGNGKVQCGCMKDI